MVNPLRIFVFLSQSHRSFWIILVLSGPWQSLALAEPPLSIPGISSAIETPSSFSSGNSGIDSGEEDYKSNVFQDYGNFNISRSEEEDLRYFQYGRFFGISIGTGLDYVTGNRGSLWEGGFPVIDFKVHYWFDFNLALDLGLTSIYHYYDTAVQSRGHVDVYIFRLGVNLRYYFDVKNLSATLTFMNPYITVGFGNYTKTENITIQASTDQQSSIGLAAGLGLEFAIYPNKTYFQFESKVNLITFPDNYLPTYYSIGLPNLTGYFITFVGSILFTW